MRGSDVLIATAVATGTVVAAPLVLSAVGFGAGGVVAGSIAAFIQGPATAAGGYFALAQSAGVLGLAGTTQAVIGAGTGGAVYVGKKALSKL